MVTPTRDPARYEVRSHSRPEKKHHVCLTDYRGNGSCECEHFECRMKPALQAGAEPGEATRCKHIAEAREFFLDDMIATLPRTRPPA